MRVARMSLTAEAISLTLETDSRAHDYGRIAIGQAPQAIVHVPNAVPDGDATQGFAPLGMAGRAVQLTLVPVARGGTARPPARPAPGRLDFPAR